MSYVTSSEFKSLAKTNKPLFGVFPVRKQFAASSEEQGNRQIKFTVSTPAADRDNDTINQAGWQLDNYKKNPVVLWGHDASALPVGKCVSIGIEDGNLTAIVEFVPEEVPIAGPMAEAVMQLCQRHFLSGVSVGFKPLEWSFPDDPERSSGVDFTSQELLEFSVVCLPSNPDALSIDATEPSIIPENVDSDKELNNNVILKNQRLMKTRILELTA